MIGVADSSKVGELLGCNENTLLGVSEWAVDGITKGIMLGIIEDSLEYSSLGLFEWYYEEVKKQTLLGLKNRFKEGDQLWTTVDSTESVSDIIRVDIFIWNSEGNIIGISDSLKLELYDHTVLGVNDSYKLGEELGCKEGEWRGVSDWYVDGIPGGNMLGTNICNEEYISIRISEGASEVVKKIPFFSIQGWHQRLW